MLIKSLPQKNTFVRYFSSAFEYTHPLKELYQINPTQLTKGKFTEEGSLRFKTRANTKHNSKHLSQFITYSSINEL
jgi:hypothetical protein